MTLISLWVQAVTKAFFLPHATVDAFFCLFLEKIFQKNQWYLSLNEYEEKKRKKEKQKQNQQAGAGRRTGELLSYDHESCRIVKTILIFLFTSF